MLSVKDGFSAGFYAVQVGVYFHVVDIYAMYCEHPSPAVRELIHTQIQVMKDSHGPQFKHCVLKVQALAQQAGFVPPSPPQIPTEYFEWANSVTQEFSAGLRPGSPEDVAHDIGYATGQVVCTWNVLTTTLMLLLRDPTAEDFHRLVGRLRDHIRTSRDDLIRHVGEPAALHVFETLAMALSEATNELMTHDFRSRNFKQLVSIVKAVQGQLMDLVDQVNRTLAVLENPDEVAPWE